MNNLYVISGVTGMTGSELARQLLKAGHSVIGFDNFCQFFGFSTRHYGILSFSFL